MLPSRQPPLARGLFTALGLIASGCAIVVAAAPGASAADWTVELSPHLMARFSRQVQPLLLNKCAAGACHGGPTAHAPHFNRGDRSGNVDRGVTLANIETLTGLVGRQGSPDRLLATISARHPASASSTNLVMSPLTPAERATLEQWLRAATGRPPAVASRPDAAAGDAPTARPPNRFRALLDAAANPPVLPPPQKPQGIILGKDGE